MFSKLNIYLGLEANFNSKFMFSKLNIQFIEIQFTELYSTKGTVENKYSFLSSLKHETCLPIYIKPV